VIQARKPENLRTEQKLGQIKKKKSQKWIFVSSFFDKFVPTALFAKSFKLNSAYCSFFNIKELLHRLV